MTDLPKKRHTAEEKKESDMVLSDFEAARIKRHSGCFWNESEDGSGGDWDERRDYQDKVYLNYGIVPDQDDYQSNVKSPMASGRIDSLMHKLRNVNLRFIVRPEDSEDSKDRAKARVVQELMMRLFRKGSWQSQIQTGWLDCLIHGDGFYQVYYLKKTRKVKLPKVEDLTEEEEQDLKDGKKVWEEKTITEYDDIMWEAIDENEIYWDPAARCFHGGPYEASYVIRKMVMSEDQFHAVFDNDPDAKNLSKVRPVGSYVDEDTPYFDAISSEVGENYIKVLHYYNKPEDKYIVLANDIVIKSQPLPYIHKEIPILHIGAIPMNHRLRNIGIVDRLSQIQSEEEILKNMVYDRLHDTKNPMWKVKNRIYGEFSKAAQENRFKSGAMLPVYAQDDVMPMEYPALDFDIFRAIDMINQDATIATQVDPSQMGMSQKYVSATTSVMTKEQRDALVNSLLTNWTREFTIGAYMVVSLMKQFYTVPRVEDALGTEAKNRRVRLEGIEINPDTMEVVKKGTDEYSFFEIDPEYFDISGDWDITVAPESIEVMSKGLEMQKSQAALAQLAPFFVDPNNDQSMMANPFGYIDGPKTVEWYLETNTIPTDLMVQTSEDEDISIKRAEEQGKAMLMGEDMPGIPGEPDAHKRVHVKQLNVQNQKVDELTKEIEGMGPMAAQYVPMLPIGAELKKEVELQQRLAKHLSEDDMPKMMTEQVALQGAAPAQPQAPNVPMPPGLTPGGGGNGAETPTLPMTPAGNQQMPQGRPALINQQ